MGVVRQVSSRRMRLYQRRVVCDAHRSDFATPTLNPSPQGGGKQRFIHRRFNKNTPCSPSRFHTHQGSADADGLAAGVERDGFLHLRADLAAQLDEVADGAEMDVGRVVPGIGQVLGHRHPAAHARARSAHANGRNSGTTRWRGGRCAGDAPAPPSAGAWPGSSATGSRNRRHRPGSRRGPCRHRPGSPGSPLARQSLTPSREISMPRPSTRLRSRRRARSEPSPQPTSSTREPGSTMSATRRKSSRGRFRYRSGAAAVVGSVMRFPVPAPPRR